MLLKTEMKEIPQIEAESDNNKVISDEKTIKKQEKEYCKNYKK